MPNFVLFNSNLPLYQGGAASWRTVGQCKQSPPTIFRYYLILNNSWSIFGVSAEHDSVIFYPSCQPSNLQSVGVLLDKPQRRLQPRSHHGAGRFSSTSPSWSCWPSSSSSPSSSSTSSSSSWSFKTITRLLGSPLVKTPFKQQRMSSAGWLGSQHRQYQYCHYYHNHHQQ